MSDRIQQLLEEVRRASSTEHPASKLGQRFQAQERSHNNLQNEIAQEIAFSLGRAGAKIERSLKLLNALLARRADDSLSEAAQQELALAFATERKAAEQYLRDLLIQREALGFRRHDDVHQRWALPSWPTVSR